MADLLTHVFVAYVLATVCTWRFERLTPAFVTVAMIGAVIPDLKRIELLVPADAVTAVLGVPFSWQPLHRLGGAAVVVAICIVVAPPRYRRRVAAALVLGVASHFVLDVYSATGTTRPFLWPLTDQGLPAGGLYRSHERWPALVSGLAAVLVWLETRRRRLRDADGLERAHRGVPDRTE
ncbi:metal-dependent hydrolase [Natronolimnohabitans innermongolicus]|uniref:Membrane-bound metal-dependent hydrolase n=1 Tax=Natronolimnohabitans innermongolicus JCM 12255 TaxID=1227499 RepID=L9XKC8_9EURY|nr:metal-dependent hydrolase [Natronolimnohabitans innermongolicus]ELY61083.1 hypothetical protein C493_03155 [Natronolimnohabitans innermongolicus JCM 12255]